MNALSPDAIRAKKAECHKVLVRDSYLIIPRLPSTHSVFRYRFLRDTKMLSTDA